MKFKKLFISISTIAPMFAALSFVSCDSMGNKGKNIFTEVNKDQEIASAKTKISQVIKQFYEDAIQDLQTNKEKQKQKQLESSKDEINSLASPLANFLLVIDSQSKEYLDYFYEANKKSFIRDISIGEKKKYSSKTIEGSNKLITFFNTITKTLNVVIKKTKYTNTALSSLLGNTVYNLWFNYFNNKDILNNKNNFFEKIGDSILKNQVAKDFWTKFIKNRYRDNLSFV